MPVTVVFSCCRQLPRKWTRELSGAARACERSSQPPCGERTHHTCVNPSRSELCAHSMRSELVEAAVPRADLCGEFPIDAINEVGLATIRVDCVPGVRCSVLVSRATMVLKY